MTPGEKLFNVLANKRTQSGGVLNKEQWIAAANEFMTTEGVMRKKKPAAAPRARNQLWDALALSTGQRNLSEVGRVAGKAVGVALADIKEVSPDVTPDEIYRRAGLYKSRHPTWTLSAPALAKHWAEFSLLSEEDRTRAARNDVYQEPKEWNAAAHQVYGVHADDLIARGWFEIDTTYRKAILAKINAA